MHSKSNDSPPGLPFLAGHVLWTSLNTVNVTTILFPFVFIACAIDTNPPARRMKRRGKFLGRTCECAQTRQRDIYMRAIRPTRNATLLLLWAVHFSGSRHGFGPGYRF